MKAQIALSRHAEADLRDLLATEFGVHGVTSLRPLMGGYSGTNYLVDYASRQSGSVEQDGGSGQGDAATTASRQEQVPQRAVLKFCNSYTTEWVQAQVEVQRLLSDQGFRGLCTPLPRTPAADSNAARAGGGGGGCCGESFVSTKLSGVPALLLSFVGGRNASHVCHERPGLARAVLRSVGEGLAALHAAGCGAPRPALRALRSFTDSGCCNLFEHLNGSFLRQLQASEHTADHPCVP
jgi:hypothetical protein